jgi:hypothetical protein
MEQIQKVKGTRQIAQELEVIIAELIARIEALEKKVG